MRKLLFFVFAYLGVALLACQDGKEAYKSPIADLDYLRHVGQRIPNQTGVRWMELYDERKAQSSGRTQSTDYAVTAEQLSSTLASVSSLVGVVFHYALDGDGNQHVIIAPIDESLSLWNTVPGRLYLDANTNEVISAETAKAWADSYRETYPSDIRFHYFGRGVFDEIQNISFFTNLRIEPAISDVDFTPQLLLVVLNESSSSTGRLNAAEGVVFDFSNPCPSSCDVGGGENFN